MNPRWLKENLAVIIFLTAAAAFIGVTVYFERQAAASKEQIEAELGDQQRQYDELTKGSAAASTENVQALKHDREQLQELYKSLQDAIGHSTIEPPKMKDEIEFGQLMRKTITQLGDLAAKDHVKIPDAFAFGFSRYGPTTPFPCRNPPVTTNECQRILGSLTKQLLVIEKLTQLAIDSGVEEIAAIRRPEVEPIGGTGGGGSDALAATIEDDPKALRHTYPFEIQFASGAKALQRFLNGLSKSDWFFAVKSLKIDTETLTGSMPAPAPVRSATATPPGASAEKSAEIKRLLVTARIDMIEFPSPETKPEKGSEKKPAQAE
jgi:cell division protein FtsB